MNGLIRLIKCNECLTREFRKEGQGEGRESRGRTRTADGRRLEARLRGDLREGGKVSQRERVGARYGTVASVGHPRLELKRRYRGANHTEK